MHGAVQTCADAIRSPRDPTWCSRRPVMVQGEAAAAAPPTGSGSGPVSRTLTHEELEKYQVRNGWRSLLLHLGWGAEESPCASPGQSATFIEARDMVADCTHVPNRYARYVGRSGTQVGLPPAWTRQLSLGPPPL